MKIYKLKVLLQNLNDHYDDKTIIEEIENQFEDVAVKIYHKEFIEVDDEESDDHALNLLDTTPEEIESYFIEEKPLDRIMGSLSNHLRRAVDTRGKR